jgi:hypothetical protein
MLTRGEVAHQYHPRPVQPYVSSNGAIRVAVVDNIIQTWAVTRPVTAPPANGAPFYFQGHPDYQVQRGGVMPLTPAKPRVQMDPSDRSTWQRDYRFT